MNGLPWRGQDLPPGHLVPTPKLDNAMWLLNTVKPAKTEHEPTHAATPRSRVHQPPEGRNKISRAAAWGCSSPPGSARSLWG